MEVLHDHDLHDLLGVKAGDHACLFAQVQAAEPAGGVTYDARHDRAAGVVHRCRLVKDVPLNASNPDVQVHGIESWERGQAKVQHCSGVTDRRVSTRLLWERRRALFDDDALASMRQLFEALLYGFKKSSPLVTMDSSEASSMSSTTAWQRTK